MKLYERRSLGFFRYIAWNQKNLDYEIETSPIYRAGQRLLPQLEIKRTSITRLKLDIASRDMPTFSAWNQKNLDYEIETKYREQ